MEPTNQNAPVNQNPPAGEPPAGTPPATPSKYETLVQKKGFKSQEDLASSYENIEQEHSKKSTILDKTKKQLEAAGYTVNDDGAIVQVSGGQGSTSGPGGYPTYQGYPPGGGQSEVVYDPYTGQPITDPVSLQLARMPVGQREAVIFNAMQEQRERQQSTAYQADSEILSKPEAKGFEDDVRKAMMQKPLHLRADKNEWNRTLLEIKGARYDADSKRWAQQGAEDFINKEGLQPLPPAGGGGRQGGAQLSSEQESQYQWYSKNKPGIFKDRAEFFKATMPNYGR